MRRLIVLSAFAALTIANSGFPPPSTCGPWVSQTNGTRWRVCTDAQGIQFCQLKTGSKITPMVCP
jgi:hypothetical protein